MRVWTGNIQDCIIAPNRALYYVNTGHIGTVAADGPEDRLGFHTDFSRKDGPLDFVRLTETRSSPPIDAVGFTTHQHWVGFTSELSRVFGYGQRRLPLGGDTWLVCGLGSIAVEIDSTSDKYPLYFRRRELDYADVSVAPHVFDEEWLVVAVPADGHARMSTLLMADRKDLRRVEILAPYSDEIPEVSLHKWTRDWLVVQPSPQHTVYTGVRPNGDKVEFRVPFGGEVLALTPDGTPICTKIGTRGVFVGDRHIDFELGGPTRGATVSSDGLTAAYWTGRRVVQFDLD